MALYRLKPATQRLILPAARSLHARGVTPNQVTLAALVLSLAAGGLVWLHPESPIVISVLAIAYGVRMLLNALDGHMARTFDAATPGGAVLNEVGDVLSDTAMLLPLIAIPGAPGGWIALAAALGVCAEVAGLTGALTGRGRRYDGPLAKPDRALLHAALALVLAVEAAGGHDAIETLAWGRWLSAFFAIECALLAVTMARRGFAASKLAETPSYDPQSMTRRPHGPIPGVPQ